MDRFPIIPTRDNEIRHGGSGYFLQKFNYPRELVIEPLSKTLQVEQFTLTDWRHYCFINGADEKN